MLLRVSVGLLAASLVPLAAEARPVPSTPVPRLLASDPFGVGRLSDPTAPVALAGTVRRVHDGTVLPSGPMRIDVYFNPRQMGPSHPFAFTVTTGTSDAFEVRGRLDPSERAYVAPGGGVDAFVLTTDLSTGAMAMSGVQLRWSEALGSWESVDGPESVGSGRVPTLHQVVEVPSVAARTSPRRVAVAVAALLLAGCTGNRSPAGSAPSTDGMRAQPGAVLTADDGPLGSDSGGAVGQPNVTTKWPMILAGMPQIVNRSAQPIRILTVQSGGRGG